MVHKIDLCCLGNSVATKAGWMASIALNLTKYRKNKLKKTRLNKLLSYSDQTLKDIGLSRQKVLAELGHNPRKMPYI